LVARLQPIDIVDHSVVSRLDTAVIGVDRFMRAATTEPEWDLVVWLAALSNP
jgi:hypothetical protein